MTTTECEAVSSARRRHYGITLLVQHLMVRSISALWPEAHNVRAVVCCISARVSTSASDEVACADMPAVQPPTVRQQSCQLPVLQGHAHHITLQHAYLQYKVVHQ